MNTVLRSTLFSAFALTALFSLPACDDASNQDDRAIGPVDEARARAVHVPGGLCQPGDCGGHSSTDACWCDDACAYYGDCCDNKVDLCDTASEGEMCGGIGGIPCQDGLTCVPDPGSCNTSDASGICQVVSGNCPKIYDPVCGCDGETYGNACEAAAAGVAVDYEGECSFCGGIGNIECPYGQHCVLDGDHPDAGGHCEPGVGEGGNCEGFVGVTCAEGLACIKEADTCDLPDTSGICTVPPFACPYDYNPVCGCDGVTYTNECYAHQAGVSVHYYDVCG